jgi:hypothetical protein
VARLGVRDGQRAFVSGICGNLVFGPFASACSSQGNSQSIAGRTHVGHRKHSADNCLCKHSAQAAFEAASGCTVHLRLVPGKVHTGSRGWRAVHHFSPTSVCIRDREWGKSPAGGESATGCPAGSADQGGRKPPVEHSQQVTQKNKRPFFKLPEVQLVLVVLASGKRPRGMEPAGAECSHSASDLRPLCPGKDKGGHPGGGIKAKSSPCGKQSVGIGRLGPPRFGTNLNRSAVIGFSNPNSLVCTLAVRAFREGQEGTKFARGTVSVKPSKRVGVHPCPGRRRRHPRGGGAALRPRLCRWVCRTQGATRASRGRPPFASGRERRPNSPGARELVLAGWFLEVRRVGEAAHPGPEPGLQVFQDWRSANITGFCHAEAALAWNADVLGITELRGSPEDAAKIGKKMGKLSRARCLRLTARA